jgi:Putative zinc-finger
MTCRTVAPYLVDLARGGVLDADRRAEVDRHLRGCDACTARLEDERALSAALGRLSQEIEVQALDPESERALLAAFDAAWAQPHPRARARVWRPLAAAAVLALAALLTWTIGHRRAESPAPIASAPVAVLPATEFVPWPGASSLPRFESGQLMRMDLPASVVLSLGLVPPASQTGVVRADVLVGQDGYARAVRLAP